MGKMCLGIMIFTIGTVSAFGQTSAVTIKTDGSLTAVGAISGNGVSSSGTGGGQVSLAAGNDQVPLASGFSFQAPLNLGATGTQVVVPNITASGMQTNGIWYSLLSTVPTPTISCCTGSGAVNSIGISGTGPPWGANMPTTPICIISGTNTGPATCHVTMTGTYPNLQIQSIVLDNAGQGYTSPTISLAGGANMENLFLVQLTANGIVLGGGANAAPTATAVGNTGQLLTGTTSSAPTWFTAGSTSGDLLYYSGSAFARLAGNSGTGAVLQESAGVPTWVANSISSGSSGIFSLGATSLGTSFSPTWSGTLGGIPYFSSTSTLSSSSALTASALIKMTGTGPASTNTKDNGAGFNISVGTAPSGSTGVDELWADSTSSRWMMNNNNAGADTVAGAASIDTFTNKTFDTAGAGNSFKINGTAITGISGTTATVETTTGSFTSKNIEVFDATGSTANGKDSGVNTNFSGTAWIPTVVGVYNTTSSLSGSISSTVILSSAPAGQYRLDSYLNETTTCTTVGSGKVVPFVIYTDSQGANSKSMAALNFTTSGSVGNVSNVATFWNASTNNISISATYSACTGGTGTYDAHFVLTRLQ
jgi:hypothetical protein